MGLFFFKDLPIYSRVKIFKGSGYFSLGLGQLEFAGFTHEHCRFMNSILTVHSRESRCSEIRIPTEAARSLLTNLSESHPEWRGPWAERRGTWFSRSLKTSGLLFAPFPHSLLLCQQTLLRAHSPRAIWPQRLRGTSLLSSLSGGGASPAHQGQGNWSAFYLVTNIFIKEFI